MDHTNTSKAAQHGYRRILITLIVIGILIPVLFTAVQMGAFTKEPVLETQPVTTDPDAPILRVASDYDFCPCSYINAKGELSGLYIEIVTEMANRLGYRLEFDTGTWLESRAKLTERKADVLVGLEIFSNMEGTLRTIPISSDELCVFGHDTLDSAAGLAGKRVALMARSVIETTYDLQCEYVEYYTNTEILQAVENGEVDYGICHAAVASQIIRNNGFHLKKSLPVAKSYPAIAVDDARPELKQQINETLQAMSADGTLGRLKEKWIDEFTKDRSFSAVVRNNQLFYVTFYLCLAVALCLCTASAILSKRQGEYIQSLLDYQQQLTQSNEEANRANRTKSEFLSHMSHDIRTPMNGILGMAARIRSHENEPEIIDDCLNKIDSASSHLLSLLNDVLDMSQLEHGGTKLEHIPFDLKDELQSIVQITEDQTNEKQVVFALHADSLTHTKLLGSPLHLRRILLNLISNAMKYNKPHGRVDLTVEELRADEARVFYRFIVSDTGIGMSKEFMEKKLYKPFTQENDNVRTVYQGTGLGMSIVDELVRAMGGTIRVESEPDVGTTFTVELDFEQDVAPQAKAPASLACADITGMQVLLVEDNALNMEIAQFVLEEMGVKLTMASNGQEAVETFARSAPGQFDAILMDIMMPVLDGIEATKVIRALPRPDAVTVPILAMTANAFDEDRQKTRAAGMNEHLTKPLDAALVREALARYYKPAV